MLVKNFKLKVKMSTQLATITQTQTIMQCIIYMNCRWLPNNDMKHYSTNWIEMVRILDNEINFIATMSLSPSLGLCVTNRCVKLIFFIDL